MIFCLRKVLRELLYSQQWRLRRDKTRKIDDSAARFDLDRDFIFYITSFVVIKTYIQVSNLERIT